MSIIKWYFMEQLVPYTGRKKHNNNYLQIKYNNMYSPQVYLKYENMQKVLNI